MKNDNKVKDHYASNGCYVEEQFEKGYKCDCSYPENGVPEVTKYGDKGVPSLLATIFGIGEERK